MRSTKSYATIILPLFACLTSGCGSSSNDESFSAAFEKTLSKHEPIPFLARATGRIGLGLIPRNYNNSVAAWTEALKVAEFLGVQVLQLPSGYWREDEPVKDHYRWEPTERFFDALSGFKLPFEISQDFGGPYFHADNMAPDYLQPIEFTDPIFLTRYLKYLNSYLEKFGDKIHRLLIHAEGGYSYFDAHPQHFEHYLNFLSTVRHSVKKKWPHIELGVNIDPHFNPALLVQFSERLDFVGFDIVQIEEVVEAPEDLEALIETLLANTAGKPLSFACGWSSAGGLGGGDDPQADFYREALRLLEKYQTRIEYMLVGQPFDENRKLIEPAYRAQFQHLPEEFVSEIVNWATQLGLIRIDGSAKPAFEYLLNSLRNKK